MFCMLKNKKNKLLMFQNINQIVKNKLLQFQTEFELSFFIKNKKQT